MNDSPQDPLKDLGMCRIINASGTMTALGASIMVPDPCNQKGGQPEIVLARPKSELANARTRNELPAKTLAEARRARMKKLLSWPDGGT